MTAKLVVSLCLGCFVFCLLAIPKSCTARVRSQILGATTPKEGNSTTETDLPSGTVHTLCPALSALEEEYAKIVLQKLIDENADLRKKVDLRARLKLTVTLCRTTARDVDRWYHTIRIDVGARQGIRKGQLVVDRECTVIGQVYEVGRDNSAVALITSSLCRILATVPQQETTGIVRGDLSHAKKGNGQPTLLLPPPPSSFSTIRNERIPVTQPWLTRNQWVRTSYISAGAPNGLLIGRITDLILDNQNLPCKALLAPASNLTNLDLLFVIAESQPGCTTNLETR